MEDIGAQCMQAIFTASKYRQMRVPLPAISSCGCSVASGREYPAWSPFRQDSAIANFDQPVSARSPATSRAWAMTMTVCPRWCIVERSSSIRRLRRSGCPVRPSGSVGKSRCVRHLHQCTAIEIRCCWPPESWLGRWSRRSPSFSAWRSAAARLAAFFAGSGVPA